MRFYIEEQSYMSNKIKTIESMHNVTYKGNSAIRTDCIEKPVDSNFKKYTYFKVEFKQIYILQNSNRTSKNLFDCNGIFQIRYGCAQYWKFFNGNSARFSRKETDKLV